MLQALTRYQALGVTSVIFGDIFLADLRKYREDNLAKIGMQAIFPLWQRDTRELIQTLCRRGFKAVTTCVDTRVLGEEFTGRQIDESFLGSLPEGIDPCGENGEYHTFVFDAPNFRHPIPIRLGEKMLREGRFYYCDVEEDQ